MSAPASGRISAAKTGWIIALLMMGWALFLFLPFGREEKIEPAKTPVERPGEADLAAVGLGYNVDWIGLPVYFTVWAEQAGWENDRTKFAYWNPTTASYSYFFEATRAAGRYRFRPIMRADLESELAYYYDEEHDALGEEVPEPKKETATHPFIFWYAEGMRGPASIPIVPKSRQAGPVPLPSPVKVDIHAPPATLPPPAKFSSPHNDQR